MPKQVQVSLLVELDDDDDQKKADKLADKLLRKSLKRKKSDGTVVADIVIEKIKGKPKKPKP